MDEEIRPTPIMFDHCLTVYNAMLEQANGNEYYGFLTKLVQNCGLPSPYYTAVVRRLKEMGCIEQVRRGGGNAVSVWKLIARPTEDLFSSINLNTKRRSTKFDSVEQQLRDMNKRINDVEAAFNVMERRVSQLVRERVNA